MKAKKCLECGYEISGRVDKKFCSDQCRNTYNNREKRDSNIYVRNVNNILRKNRRILQALNPKGKAKVHRNKLNEKGLHFDYHTSTYTTKAGKTYIFCYDYGYLPIENDFYFLVKKDDYLN